MQTYKGVRIAYLSSASNFWTRFTSLDQSRLFASLVGRLFAPPLGHEMAGYEVEDTILAAYDSVLTLTQIRSNFPGDVNRSRLDTLVSTWAWMLASLENVNPSRRMRSSVRRPLGADSTLQG